MDPACRKQHASHCKALGWDPKIGCPVECPEIKKCEDCLTLDKFCLKENSKSCRSLGWHRTKGCPQVCTAVQPQTCEACNALEKHCQKLHNKSCRLFFSSWIVYILFQRSWFSIYTCFFFFLIFLSHYIFIFNFLYETRKFHGWFKHWTSLGMSEVDTV